MQLIESVAGGGRDCCFVLGMSRLREKSIGVLWLVACGLVWVG